MKKSKETLKEHLKRTCALDIMFGLIGTITLIITLIDIIKNKGSVDFSLLGFMMWSISMIISGIVIYGVFNKK